MPDSKAASSADGEDDEKGVDMKDLAKPLVEFVRVFRYALPGLVFVIELWLWLFLFRRTAILEWFERSFWPLTAEKSSVAAALLITIGFILSIIYHPVVVFFSNIPPRFVTRRPVELSVGLGTELPRGVAYGTLLGFVFGTVLGSLFGILFFPALIFLFFIAAWLLGFSRPGPFQDLLADYRQDIATLEEDGLIATKYDRHKNVAENLSPEGAWRVSTFLWHCWEKQSSILASANPRAQSLNDLLHGLGACWAAGFFAFMLALPEWTRWAETPSSISTGPLPWYWVSAVLGGLMVMHGWSYYHIRTTCYRYCALTLYQALSDARKRGTHLIPMSIPVVKSDLWTVPSSNETQDAEKPSHENAPPLPGAP